MPVATIPKFGIWPDRGEGGPLSSSEGGVSANVTLGGDEEDLGVFFGVGTKCLIFTALSLVEGVGFVTACGPAALTSWLL